MKTISTLIVAGAFAAITSASAFASCKHGYEAADLSELQIAADVKKPEEAMSTFDPANIDALLDAEKPVDKIKKAE